MEAPSFTSRWLIRGTLTTRTPLHIGDGDAGEVHERHSPARRNIPGKEDENDAQTVCVDHHGRACIPGSAIKGPLRARLKQALKVQKLEGGWQQLLGADTADDDDAVGGKVEFSDAFLVIAPGQAEPAHLPYWDHNRRTAVAASVCINRRKNTAEHQLLYHIEYVPKGAVFSFELTGENLEEDHVRQLLALLNSLNDLENPVTLGAQESNGWGQVHWQLQEVRRFAPKDLDWWMAHDVPPVGYAACRPIGEEEQSKFKDDAETHPLKPAPSLNTMDLRLHFDGPLLVRDPQQGERREKSDQEKLPEAQKPPNAIPIFDESGRPCLPAKTVRGILRGHAEKILRTLGAEKIPEPSSLPHVGDLEAARKLDPISKLFGAPGWRGPLTVSRFEWANGAFNLKSHQLHQEFVAIDRFTGGAAERKKFDCLAVKGAVFKGSLTLDMDRLKNCGADRYALELIALVLRDLAEGDLRFGSGAARGYGSCAASIIEGERQISLDDWIKANNVNRSLDNLLGETRKETNNPQPSARHAR